MQPHPDWTQNYDQVEREIPELSSKFASSDETQPMLQAAAPLSSRPALQSSTSAGSSTGGTTPESISRFPPHPSAKIPSSSRPLSMSSTPPQLVSRKSESDLSVNSLTLPSRSTSSKSFAPSPLNPTTPTQAAYNRFSTVSMAQLRQFPSEDSRALSVHSPSNTISRASMILYRFADTDELLAPPKLSHLHRSSMYSTSGDSILSISSDSKYPSGSSTPERGVVAYAYDPDDMDAGEAEADPLHDPELQMEGVKGSPWRGIMNLAALICLLAAIISLFIVYPVFTEIHASSRERLIVENTRINSTGQAFRRSQISLSETLGTVDSASPSNVRYRTGPDETGYELVFSDEFTAEVVSDRLWQSVYPGSESLTTRESALVLRRNTTTDATAAKALISTRSPVCVSQGFVEVGIKKSGLRSDVRLFWTGDWTIASSGVVVPSETFDSSLDIFIGFDDLDRPTVSTELPFEVSFDYVRIYQSLGQDCDSATPHRKLYLTPYLDYLSTP